MLRPMKFVTGFALVVALASCGSSQTDDQTSSTAPAASAAATSAPASSSSAPAEPSPELPEEFYGASGGELAQQAGCEAYKPYTDDELAALKSTGLTVYGGGLCTKDGQLTEVITFNDATEQAKLASFGSDPYWRAVGKGVVFRVKVEGSAGMAPATSIAGALKLEVQQPD